MLLTLFLSTLAIHSIDFLHWREQRTKIRSSTINMLTRPRAYKLYCQSARANMYHTTFCFSPCAGMRGSNDEAHWLYSNERVIQIKLKLWVLTWKFNILFTYNALGRCINKNRFIMHTVLVLLVERWLDVCVCSRFYGGVGALRLRLQEALCIKKRALASYAFCLKINTQVKACAPPTRLYIPRTEYNNLCTLCKSSRIKTTFLE